MFRCVKFSMQHHVSTQNLLDFRASKSWISKVACLICCENENKMVSIRLILLWGHFTAIYALISGCDVVQNSLR